MTWELAQPSLLSSNSYSALITSSDIRVQKGHLMNIRRRSTRRWLAGAATLPLLVGGLSVVTASPADAITCIHPAWSNKDAGSGQIWSGYHNINMYDGPMSSCIVVAVLNPGQTLYYDCYYLNAA